jgi:hypothetical protein
VIVSVILLNMLPRGCGCGPQESEAMSEIRIARIPYKQGNLWTCGQLIKLPIQILAILTPILIDNTLEGRERPVG